MDNSNQKTTETRPAIGTGRSRQSSERDNEPRIGDDVDLDADVAVRRVRVKRVVKRTRRD